MKIGIMGTHCTGKTTLARSMAADMALMTADTRETIGLLPEIVRNCPFKVNRDSGRDSVFWIFFSQFVREIEMTEKYDIVVCDRTVLDPLAYAWALGYTDLVELWMPAALEHFKSYQKVYFMRPVGPPVDDGFRDIDPVFRDEVDDILKWWVIDNHLTVIEHVESCYDVGIGVPNGKNTDND